ncbi:hypothetical protein [Bradyrhizobium sp. CCBAU 51765]|uniref:hypothetical protein n=1 Tax=Bradyrhizobium sp. CCBAU 51765 TaxID=1325102 RepID=UPI0018876ABF|nr:hypothetical protein [Bradyrhizobium sp. CCBAU 51765]QOZ09565.1 hypothetical protein XH96_20020 [Bradyrhizobium sp. CCBAU 51765]
MSRWKASLDHAEKRIDDLCAEITKLADLASEYWITPQADAKIPVLQARISSGLVRIATMRVTLSKFVLGLADERLVDLESSFVRQATGGDFGVHNRAPSQSTAAAAQHAGSALVVEIRRSRLASFTRWWTPKV